MIIVTGGAGFIGSAYIWYLNSLGKDNIFVVDKLRNKNKWKNLVNVNFYDFIDKENIDNLLENNNIKISSIIHMGACSSTVETNVDYFIENNYKYSQRIWNYASKNKCDLIYASSAATYGNGNLGFDDNIFKLKPLNPYGFSKYIFDNWVLKQVQQKNVPRKWAGLKFFNVYGPNEYHKNNMASVIFHAFNQISQTNKMKLFKSYNKDFKHGYQLRDFIYVKDIVKIIDFFRSKSKVSGIFNCGTGKPNSFYDLVKFTFKAMNKKENIKFIDMPISIRDKYQYYTKAELGKLKDAGYIKSFYSLESGVNDYVTNYLLKDDKYLN